MTELLTCPEVADAATAGQCEAMEFQMPCDSPDVAVLVEWGCVHEHTSTALVCAAHWSAIQRVPAWYCDECLNVGCIDCPVAIREVPRA